MSAEPIDLDAVDSAVAALTRRCDYHAGPLRAAAAEIRALRSRPLSGSAARTLEAVAGRLAAGESASSVCADYHEEGGPLDPARLAPVVAVIAERDALRARVAEVEGERDALRREVEKLRAATTGDRIAIGHDGDAYPCTPIVAEEIRRLRDAPASLGRFTGDDTIRRMALDAMFGATTKRAAGGSDAS